MAAPNKVSLRSVTRPASGRANSSQFNSTARSQNNFRASGGQPGGALIKVGQLNRTGTYTMNQAQQAIKNDYIDKINFMRTGKRTNGAAPSAGWPVR